MRIFVGHFSSQACFQIVTIPIVMISKLCLVIACALPLMLEAGDIYWTTWNQGISDGIYRSNADGDDVSRIIGHEDLVPDDFAYYVGLPIDLVVDAAAGHIYFVETETDTIWRTDPTGTVFSEILVVEGEDPHQLEVDLENGFIYWVEDNGPSSPARIGRCDLAGLNPTYLVQDAGTRVGGFTMDVQNGELFWTESYAGPTVQLSVWRSDLQGFNPRKIISNFPEGTFELGAVAIDTQAQKVYWIQDQEVIRMANYDGSQDTKLVEESALGDRSSMAVDSTAGAIYWTGGYGSRTIGRVNLAGYSSEPLIENLTSNPLGIFVDVAGASPVIQLGDINSDTMTVSWTQPSVGWLLEISPTLAPGDWSPVPEHLVTLDGNFGSAELDATLDHLFVRLRRLVE